MTIDDLYDQLDTLINSISRTHKIKPDLRLPFETATLYHNLRQRALEMLNPESDLMILPELSTQTTLAGALACCEQFQTLLAKYCKSRNNNIQIGW